MPSDASALTTKRDLAPGYAAYRRAATVDVHNEAVFRHLLNIERKRAEQASRSVLLVLVSIRGTPGRSDRVAPRTASAVFSALGSSVREVDFIGWFRDGQVAAAVLVHQGPDQSSTITARITERLKRELRDAAPTLRLRAISLGTERR